MGSGMSFWGVIARLVGWIIGGAIVGALIWAFVLPVNITIPGISNEALGKIGNGAVVGAIAGAFLWSVWSLIRGVGARQQYHTDVDSQFEITRGGFKEIQKPGMFPGMRRQSSGKSSVKRIPDSSGADPRTRAVFAILVVVIAIGVGFGLFVGGAELVESIGTFNLAIYGTVALVVVLMIIIAIMESTSRE